MFPLHLVFLGVIAFTVSPQYLTNETLVSRPTGGQNVSGSRVDLGLMGGQLSSVLGRQKRCASLMSLLSLPYLVCTENRVDSNIEKRVER